MRRITGGLAAASASATCVALAAGLGCNAIAGIQDGQLATIDSGSVVDGTAEGSVDSGGGGMDGPTGDAGQMDSTTASDSTAPLDASDAAAIPPVRCAINPGSKTLVADLSAFADAGSCCGNPAQFQQSLWALPLTNDNNGVEIVAQNAADQTDFSLYQLNFGQGGMPTPTAAGSSAMGGVRLLDVEPTPNGPPTALTTVGTGSNTQALQVVTLPTTNGAAPGSPLTITGTVLNNAYPNGGALLPLGSNAYDWLLEENSSGTNQLISGNNGAMQVTLASGSQSPHFSSPPVALGANLYAFVMGVGDAGNASAVIAYPADFSTTGTESPILSSASLSAVIQAHVSVSDSTKAALLGATIDSSGAGSVQLWAAQAPASSLSSLTLGSPPFTAGTSFGLAEVPFNGGATVRYGDQTFIVGTGQGDSTTMLLVWINAQGVAVARPAVMGPLLSGANVIRYSTVAVGQSFSQYELGLFLVWIEEVQGSGGEYDQLWAAQVTCQPIVGD